MKPLPQRTRFRTAAIAAVGAALLSGCATGYLMDSQVQSFSGLPAQPAALTYTFERLPSQANQPAQQRLEALADPALFRAGFRRDDAAPRYTVQVSARVQQTLSPWADPWDTWGWGGPYGWGGHRFGPGFGWGPAFPRMDQPWFQREVGLVVREAAGARRVVYETRATHDGPLVDNGAALSAMFEAALQGFPNPPPGPRRVDVKVGGRTRAAASDVPAAPAASTPAAGASTPAR